MPLILHRLESLSAHLQALLEQCPQSSTIASHPRELFLVPNAQAAQDLRDSLLKASPQGLLLGPVVQTIDAWANFILEAHPHPALPAPKFLQRQVLKKIFAEHKVPDVLPNRRLFLKEQAWLLDQAYFNEGKINPSRLPKAHQAYLEAIHQKNFLSLSESQEQAWQLLENNPPRLLKPLQSIHFLGWTYPTGQVRRVIQACLKGMPSLKLHLYLAPVEKLSHPLGEDQKFWEFLLEQSQTGVTYHQSLKPKENNLVYPSTLHESQAIFSKLDQNNQLVLLPGASESFKLIQTSLDQQGLSEQSDYFSLKEIYRLVSGRLRENLTEETLSLKDYALLLEKELQKNLPDLIKKADPDLIKNIKTLQKYLQEFIQSEENESYSIEDCFLEIFKELPLQKQEALGLPYLGGLEGVRLQVVDHLWIAGLSADHWPPPKSFGLFVEASENLWRWTWQKHLQQIQSLATQELTLSYAKLNLGGQEQNPVFAEKNYQALLGELNFNTQEKQPPFWEENLQREQARQHESLGPDQGDLTTLAGPIQKQLTKEGLSPSALDLYSDCPWKFFAARLLKLEEIPKPDLGLPAKDLGAWAHEVLEKTYAHFLDTHFRKRQIPSLEALIQKLEEFWQSSKTTKAKELPTAPFFEQESTSLLEQVKSLIRVEWEDWQASPDRLLPYLLEVPFKNFYSLEDRPTLTIRGFIDRIDRSPTQALVLDYKKGNTDPLGKKMRTGESFQLYLYLKALKTILKEPTQSIGALYWSLKNTKRNQGLALKEEIKNTSKLSTRGDSFVSPEKWEESLAKLEENLIKTLKHMTLGYFPLEPKKDTCQYCAYGETCRIKA